jgi:hypothetical protein
VGKADSIWELHATFFVQESIARTSAKAGPGSKKCKRSSPSPIASAVALALTPALCAQTRPVLQAAARAPGQPHRHHLARQQEPDAAAKVTGALEVVAGKAIIAASGTVTSGSQTTEVILPHRGRAARLRLDHRQAGRRLERSCRRDSRPADGHRSRRPRNQFRHQSFRRPQRRHSADPRFSHPHRRSRRGRGQDSPRPARRHLRG